MQNLMYLTLVNKCKMVKDQEFPTLWVISEIQLAYMPRILLMIEYTLKVEKVREISIAFKLIWDVEIQL